ncbi:MAG: hypothetical protein JEZ11_10295 [Desulfobacterales bacterium]|nr:hypothetical protein [Desulfobacterales bacterium]
MAPVYALIKAGYSVEKIILTTLQALSGAGYPEPAAIDLVDNIIPFIGGEGILPFHIRDLPPRQATGIALALRIHLSFADRSGIF